MIGLSYADTHTADSCSLTHVQAAVDAADRDDTVAIPAGDCTWTSRLEITKSIKIQGAGKASTFIRSGRVGKYFILAYTPSAPSTDEAYVTDVSGITWDMNNQSRGLQFNNRTGTTTQTVRVFDNDFIDCWGGTGESDPMSYALEFYGRFKGVVYNNSFTGFPYISNNGDGVTNFNSSLFNVVHGTDNFMYYEDNLFTSTGTTLYPGREPFLITQDNGAKTIMRYNDFVSERTWTTHYKPWSPHHPAGGVNTGGKGGEFYGNSLTNSAGTAAWEWSTTRSGKNLLFYNRIYAPYGNIQWTMYNPTTYTPVTTDYACGVGVYASWVGVNYCDASGQPEHLWRSYQWVVKYGNTGTGTYTHYSVSDGGRLTENQHYFNYQSSFNGTIGVGCGTLANRPSTCTTGVGYWATDQSCTDIEAMVGRDPATPIAGTLYKCNTKDNWAVYYTPYSYPHPLRSDVPEDDDPPSISNLLPLTEQACDDLDDTEDIGVSLTAVDQTQGSVVCYVDTTERANYAALAAAGTLMTASGTTFSATLAALACSERHTVWYGCTDGTTASSVGTFEFTIATRGETTAPTITSTTIQNQGYYVYQRMTVTTNSPATVKYCVTGETIGEGVCDADTTYDDMPHTFSQTGGDTGHMEHSSALSQAASSTVVYFVRAMDTQQNKSSSSTAISISTDSAKTISIGSGGLTLGIGTGSNTLTVIP
jgi:hypothetical protein